MRELQASQYNQIAPLIIAQAKHETGNFSSRLFREQNNLFGMGIPVVRPFVGVKDYQSNFMRYGSPVESLKDLFLYFDYVKFPRTQLTPEQFVTELKQRKYFEDSLENYLNGIKRFL